MKILQINTVYGKGSTGKIAQGIHDVCIKRNIQCISAYRYFERKHEVFDDTMAISSWMDCHIHNRMARYTGMNGLFSYHHTKTFLEKVTEYGPDIIHLHNLHGNYINLSLLFSYIKNRNIRTIWTLHDCWAFTGGCPHFTIQSCYKWKSGCQQCPQQRTYLDFFTDISGYMWRMKKEWFCGINDMTIVTPSLWLADLAKASFLGSYPVMTINNGIDLNVFTPTASDFRKKHGIEEKRVLLGVAFDWGRRKGLDVIFELAKRLDDTYRIVLVGTNESIDSILPENIISIHKTENQQQLAEIYSAADLFVNPTREENYPTVNMEAIACGTPVLTFRTGGSPEMLTASTGAIVDCDDIDSMEREIRRICEMRPFKREDCVKAAQAFDMQSRFEEYVRLYEDHPYRA